MREREERDRGGGRRGLWIVQNIDEDIRSETEKNKVSVQEINKVVHFFTIT